jgi:mannose-6-phosphate isomerase
MLNPFRLIPTYRDYVWGGKRLRPDAEITAESWMVYEENKVVDGPYAGSTLAEVANQEGMALLGTKVVAQTGSRFPLLIKLLDSAKWLSLQVHPNDTQAERLEGPGHFGKTEAWYVVAAEEDAQLLSGFRGGVTREEIRSAVGKADILNLVEWRKVKAGDSIFISPGTIHALGPGLLIYEVQQTSDLTYRVYDWDRPMTGSRKLHLDQAITVLDPDARGEVQPLPFRGESTSNINLITCRYFLLDLIVGDGGRMQMDTRGESFVALTTLEGEVTVLGKGWETRQRKFETLLIPAVCGTYLLELMGHTRALIARIP